MLQNEPLLSLPQAVEIATGQRRSPATCHRWRLKGINDIRLETAKLGGRRVTSVEAVRRFVKQTTAASDCAENAVSKPSDHQEAAIRKAESFLKNAGV